MTVQRSNSRYHDFKKLKNFKFHNILSTFVAPKVIKDIIYTIQIAFSKFCQDSESVELEKNRAL